MIEKNPFKNSSKLLFMLSLLWATVLLLIGGWWVYLMYNFESILATLSRERMARMILWEGGSFIILLLLISFTLLILFLKDQQKSKSLQIFFASLTHELKTPLASMRLQGEVISELLNQRESHKNEAQLHKLLGRLIEDTNKLETQMDKILQLSRMERGGELNLTSVKLIPFIKRLSKDWLPKHHVEILCENNDVTIHADEFALQLIVKNLMENTLNHTASMNVTIKITELHDTVVVHYNDGGEFHGDAKKLGSLFYKHNSSKGSGIGLYLSQQLMSKMHGKLTLNVLNNRLSFKLTLHLGERDHA